MYLILTHIIKHEVKHEVTLMKIIKWLPISGHAFTPNLRSMQHVCIIPISEYPFSRVIDVQKRRNGEACDNIVSFTWTHHLLFILSQYKYYWFKQIRNIPD